MSERAPIDVLRRLVRALEDVERVTTLQLEEQGVDATVEAFGRAMAVTRAVELVDATSEARELLRTLMDDGLKKLGLDGPAAAVRNREGN